MAEPVKGEACEVVAGRERLGRIKANKIIGATTVDWNRMRATYAGSK